MDKYLVIIFVENQFLQYSLEELLPNIRNGVINRKLINVRREIELPIFEINGKIYLTDTHKQYALINKKEAGSTVLLKHGDILSISNSEFPYQILWVSKNQLSINMKRIPLPDQGSISIGRSDDVNILLDTNESISRHHALIKINDGRAMVEDISGKAGVYLNGKKIVASRLKCGDRITIMGSTLVYMRYFLMIPENVSVKNLGTSILLQHVGAFNEVRDIPFERTPRIYKSLITEPIVIDAPPQKQERKQLPFILAAGPSLTMTLAMMAQLGLTISKVQQTGDYTSVISGGTMVISLLAGAALWPFLSRRYYKKQDRIAEKYRKDRYQAYLEDKKEFLEKEQKYNCWIWNEEYYPSMEEMLDYVSKRSRRLWEKSSYDQDFLFVRLGMGEKVSEIAIKVPEKHFTMYDDEMLDQAYHLEEEHRKITDVPIAISLLERRIIGIVGDREKINKMAWCMITGIVTMHSPDEVKIGFIGDKSQLFDFEWMLMLPHIWNEQGTLRFFASESNEVHNLLLYLEEETKKEEVPYFVLFVLNDRILENEQMGKSSYILKNIRNVSLVYVAEYFSRIPKETEAIVLNDSEQSGIYRKNEDNNQFVRFVPDELNFLQVQEMARLMNRLKLEFNEKKMEIPTSVSFLEMYHVGNVRMLDIKRRWKESRISRSMAAPIGIKENGELFHLDIHEKYHGCHGLVAGMTGSGKSEFLQEYILSLMVNYSPEDVAFILIDFKGGDMARPFLKAPHLSATISNLSGNMLYRARVSIEAEIQKRQILFNKTAQLLGVDKLDINSWHKYLDEGRIKDKLPHLIIIIDEFAQLKTQQPDFLEYLINVAQVGRSLGIHLILATQKPNGVVSPQIWSNSRFRVCLKVLDQEDSKEMIRRGDAAAIKLPGRAFIQVGYDEVFEQVQTGYSGADYIETKKYLQTGENSVELLDHTAVVQRTATKRLVGRKSGKSQLEETVSEIINVSSQLNLQAEPLWRPPLKEKIYLKDCIKQTCNFEETLWDIDQEGRAVCGICDLPHLQSQIPFEINLIKDGHVAVYGISGTGKTVFIQTLLYSLALCYSPKMMQLYVIDFGGRTLGNLREMPQCIDVAYEENQQKIEDLILQVMNQMEIRKKLFAEKECNTYDSYLKVSNTKLPMILLVIDNYGAFREQMYQMEEHIIQLAANAKTYGIYLVLTGNSRNAIYYKVSEHIGTKILFQMSDQQHYRELLNCRTSLILEDIKGRALVKYKDTIAEMQTALPFAAENEAEMYKLMKRNYKLMQITAPMNKQKERVEISYKKLQSFADIGNPADSSANISDRGIPSFPAIYRTDEYYVMGKSLRDGSWQGYSSLNTHRIFIGTAQEICLENIITEFENIPDKTRFLFSLHDETSAEWKMLRTEDDICEFVNRCISNDGDKILLINDFSDFYDTISDDDLVTFGKYLQSDKNVSLTVITVGRFSRLEDYRDTGLYVHLVRCPNGMIMQGNIDNTKITLLCNELSKCDPAQRTKELNENQAILYKGDKLSYISLEGRE